MSTRLSEAQKAHLVATYEASGQTQLEFCTTHGIAKSTFYHWQKKYGGQVTAPHSRAFIALAPVGESDTIPTITLTYPNGVTLSLATANLDLLQHLIQCGSDV